MTPRRNQIAALAAAIERVARLDLPADSALSAFFREHHEIGARDRAWVSDGVFAYLRRKRSYEALAEDATPRHLALAVVVREFGHSVRELEETINASDARWLAGFKSRHVEALPPAVAADVPDWLWTRLGDVYGDDTRAALTRSWQSPARFDMRANVLKTTRDAAVAALAAEGYDVAPTPYAPNGLRIAGRPSLAPVTHTAPSPTPIRAWAARSVTWRSAIGRLRRLRLSSRGLVT